VVRVTGVVVKTVGVEFFCCHRDRPGSVALRDELREEHWSYMDRYAAVLVRARDPDTARAILTPDRYADVEVHSWQFGGRPS
jgi:hypothetical protein